MAKSSQLEKLEKQFRKNPESRLFFPVAEAYRNDGDYEQAIEIYQQGLQHHPNYISARVSLGRALIALNRYDEAQRELEIVIHSVADNLMAQKLLAEIYTIKGNLGAALERYNEILVFNPEDQEAQTRVAELSKATGQVFQKDQEDQEDVAALEESEDEATVSESIMIDQDLPTSDLQKSEPDVVIAQIDSRQPEPVEHELWTIPDEVKDTDNKTISNETSHTQKEHYGTSKADELDTASQTEEDIATFDWESREKETVVDQVEKMDQDDIFFDVKDEPGPTEKLIRTEKIFTVKKQRRTQELPEKAPKSILATGTKHESHKETTHADTELSSKEKLEDKSLETKTMADLYEQQGHYQDALDIYQKLVDAHPNRTEYLKKITEITQKMRKQNEMTTVKDKFTIEPAEVDLDFDRYALLSKLEKMLQAVESIRMERELK